MIYVTYASSKAFGDNLAFNSGKYCIDSGDVNQDGYIDFSVLTLVDNNSYNFIGVQKPGINKKNAVREPKNTSLKNFTPALQNSGTDIAY